MSIPKVTIEFKKVHPDAVVPEAKDTGDVGMDIYAVEDIVIPGGKTKLIDTGLQLANVVEQRSFNDVYANGPSVLIKIEGRSGLASKGIFPTGGIVDPNYRGIVKVALNNINDEEYKVAKGDRIAQFVIYPVYSNYFHFHNRVLTVKETDHITETTRGTAGFGSSGR